MDGGTANRIEAQIRCTELKGVSVDWRGSVQTAKAVRVDNSLEILLQYLPDGIADSLRCFYGRRLADDEWPARRKRCTLSDHNSYTLELEVSGPFGRQIISSAKGSLVLEAGHVFKQLMVALQEGDVVRFVASFEDYPVLRYPPRLRLLALQCVTCKGAIGHRVAQTTPGDATQTPTPKSAAVTETDRRRQLMQERVMVRDLSSGSVVWNRLFYSFKFLFNFLFAPVLYVPTD